MDQEVTMTQTRRTALAVLIASAVTCAGGPALVANALPGDEGSVPAAELQYLIEEEKLAGDVYELALGEYGDQIFSHIAVSEDTHVDSVRTLLLRYEVADPTIGNAAGEFTDPSLQGLYDQLAQRVQTSRSEAMAVGILIEETDITDLGELLEMAPPADVEQVVENLLAGSLNHLAAFEREVQQA